MPDMADFANDYQEASCMEAEKYKYASQTEQYELGLCDELGRQSYECMNAGKTWASVVSGNKAKATKPYNHEVAYNNYLKAQENRAKTQEYLRGFAKFYKERGFLSAKQKAIIDTNWPGGSEAFIASLAGE